MKRGHIVSLLGSALVLFGGTALEWQRFALAGVGAHGFEVPVVAQIILALALIVGAAAGIGAWRERHARRAAAVTVSGGVFLLGWLAYAAGSPGGAVATMPHETVALGAGYGVALVGAALALLGGLGSLASEPRWDPARRMLRVALIWDGTIVSERVLYTARDVRVGPAPSDDFVVGGLDDSLRLFVARPDGSYELALDGGVGGHLTRDGRANDVAALRATGEGGAVVDEGDWGILEVGGAEVFFQFVRPEHGQAPARHSAGVEEPLATALSGSFFAQVAVVVVAVLLWDAHATQAFVTERRMDAAIEASVTTLEDPEALELPDDSEVADMDAASKQAEGPEGTFGVEDDPAPETHVPRIDEGRMVKEVDPRKVGLVDLLANDRLMGPGSALAEVLSPSGAAMEERLAVLTSGVGSQFALGPGSNGLGFTGGETGGGGPDGTGRIQGRAPIDVGPGRNVAVRTALGPKTPRRVPRVTDHVGTGSQFCKVQDIRSKVSRRLGAVRACYEQRLAVNDSLRGKLTLRWTIGLSGDVSGVGVDADTMRDPSVSNCVMRAIRRIRFEEPNGGVCVVRWPFVFDVD